MAKSNFILQISSDIESNCIKLTEKQLEYLNSDYKCNKYIFWDSIVTISYTKNLKYYTDEKKQFHLYIFGEIYNSNSILKTLLCEYKNTNKLNIKDLDGSFALILVDNLNELVLVGSDRLNSKKVFYEKYDNSYFFYSSIYLCGFKKTLNLSSLASYICNGYIIDEKTIFNEINILKRACCFVLKKNILYIKKYWDLVYTSEYTTKSIEKLQNILGDLLLESINKRIIPGKKLFISLSAGYDATAILGTLKKTKATIARCITYKYGMPQKSNDETIAPLLANVCDYKNELFDTYNGSLMTIFEKNAKIGQGLTYCDDAIVWDKLFFKSKDTNSAIIFVGDHNFGVPSGKTKTDSDIFTSLGIFSSQNMFEYVTKSINENYRDEMLTNYIKMLESIISRVKINSQYDKRNYINFDQKVSNLFLNWRENFLGENFIVMNPLLDNKIIDFTSRLCSDLRKNKIFFKNTVKFLYPELYKYPRALGSSFTEYIQKGYKDNENEIRNYIQNNPSILDSIFKPNLFFELLNSIISTKKNKNNYLKKTIISIKGKIRNSKNGEIFWKLKKFKNPSSIVLDNKNLLNRMITMRMFLKMFDVHIKK